MVGRPTASPIASASAVLHRTRLLLMRQQTRLANAIRGHMAEYGIVAPSGREGLQRLIETIVDASDDACRLGPWLSPVAGPRCGREPDVSKLALERFGHKAWCGMLWLLTLSITTCSVWPRSHGVPTARPVLRRLFRLEATLCRCK
jgi:hypothetical protein